ncbi:dolichyl-phosphate-mannose--protein mannosyltransferase [Phormidium sp. CCY1219]|uniref:dolichyl-phosphate-mannose--protein mannosyltransferase n=1 Tax=Phormidium sp. CCY1219 TaxID=2886104 RepID=UPI002D1F5E13|nr:phospholipid carrier-dependent glycosyltransferase [Phormidium sp. CCY1219]MEB3831632.1 phospholipid carrier-dependent glycosyltransferase [Phormidium sp. CCY1219]
MTNDQQQMTQLPKQFPWYAWGLAGIFFVSLALRFWGLSRFNTLVFDEVYYAKFANNYLTQTEFFDGHPPLAKYIIAIAMWIGSHLPIGTDTQNTLAGSLRTTWSYRWLNALTGSFLPLVIAGIAHQLTCRRSYGLIAALFAALDGLFLVESRYALVNVYLVLFGLLGQYFVLQAVGNGRKPHWVKLGIAGVFFGASAAIKWNGLGFLLGSYLVWIAAKLWRRKGQGNERAIAEKNYPSLRLGSLGIWPMAVNLGLVPALVYRLSWIPHIYFNPKYDFWEVNRQILGFHQRVGNTAQVHPYCSSWLSWPLMIRPVLYLYEKAGGKLPENEIVPSVSSESGEVVYAVHAIGNPVLWWFSTAAIALLMVGLGMRMWERVQGGGDRPIPSDGVVLYLGLNYLANWLPWAKVTRCLFLYHYMGSLVFAGLALAWLVDRWWRSSRPHLRAIAIGAIGLSAIAFWYWMPIYLGLPITAQQWSSRMWLPSWY